MTVEHRFVSPVSLWIRAALRLLRRRELYAEKSDAAFLAQLEDARRADAAFAETAAGFRRIAGCEAELRDVCGVPTLFVNGAPSADRPLIVYFHGGGFLYRPGKLQRRMIAVLAKKTGAAAALPLYPLLPDGGAEAALAALEPWYAALCDERAGGVSFVGDSAGGWLALRFARFCREKALPAPSCLVLFSPWLDPDVSSPESERLEKRDCVLAVGGLRRFGEMWTGGGAAADLSRTPLSGTTPVALFTGTRELLYPQALALRDRSGETGLAFYRYRGMDHVFACYLTPEGMRARAQAARFLRENGRRAFVFPADRVLQSRK